MWLTVSGIPAGWGSRSRGRTRSQCVGHYEPYTRFASSRKGFLRRITHRILQGILVIAPYSSWNVWRLQCRCSNSTVWTIYTLFRDFCTGMIADNSTGDEVSDQYHHYLVSQYIFSNLSSILFLTFWICYGIVSNCNRFINSNMDHYRRTWSSWLTWV